MPFGARRRRLNADVRGGGSVSPLRHVVDHGGYQRSAEVRAVAFRRAMLVAATWAAVRRLARLQREGEMMGNDPGETLADTGFVLGEDEGEAFWFLNTVTINKLGGEHTHGDVTIVDHRVPAGFAPPPHIHHGADEAFYILEGVFEGFCGDKQWRAGPGSLVFLPRDVPMVSRCLIRVPDERS